jgi:hypothetical protein
MLAGARDVQRCQGPIQSSQVKVLMLDASLITR